MTKPFVLDPTFCPFHITDRCINREWFSLPMPDVWTIMENYLYFIVKAYEVEIHAFVLMPNHFHLILSQPKNNLSEAMNYFMRETSRRISYASGRINQTYGRRFHRSLISRETYFYHAYKYVYRNPVKAKLCEKVEDYPYSTLQGLLGFQKLIIPMAEDTILFNESGFRPQALEWLNKAPAPNSEWDIKKALRRKNYELPKNKNSKMPSPLEKIQLY